MNQFNKTWLFDAMLNHFIKEYKGRRKARIINLGGSRSGKTIQTALLLFFLADKYKITKTKRKDSMQEDSILDVDGQMDLIIDVYRCELKKTRKTFEDFIIALGLLGIKKNVEFSSSNADRPWIRFPNGNTINFYGLPEDGSELQASASHIVYFNETLEIKGKNTIKNVVMRCELMVIYDSNPSATSHWLFDMVDKDKRIFYTQTNYKDNEFLPQQTVDEIEGYCPWDLSYYVQDPKTKAWYWTIPEEERPINQKNFDNDTADRRNWLIYGEGNRCARDGAAFDPIWINEFPTDISYDIVAYGLDFGFTSDETALVRMAISCRNMYVKLLFYEQIASKNDGVDYIIGNFYEKIKLIFENERKEFFGDENRQLDIVCESQDNRDGRSVVMLLRNAALEENNGLNFFKVKKYKFKIQGVDLINRYKLHIVKDTNIESEFLNFVFEEKDGGLTTILHGKNGRNNKDHSVDATLYVGWEIAPRLI